MAPALRMTRYTKRSYQFFFSLIAVLFLVLLAKNKQPLNSDPTVLFAPRNHRRLF